MEGEVKGKSSTISDYVRLDNLVWGIITLLVGFLAYYLRDTFGLAGIVVTLLSIGLAFSIYKYFQLKKVNKELTSDGAREDEVRKIYLKHLMDPNTICGHELAMEDGTNGPLAYTSEFEEGDYIEIFAFSNKKFNFTILDYARYAQLKKIIEKESSEKFLNIATLRKFDLTPDLAYNNVPSFRVRYEIQEEGHYVFFFTRSEHVKTGEIKISFIMSDVPQSSQNDGS